MDRKEKSKSKKLTRKQLAFIHHYLTNGFNGVRAARAAGYDGDYNVLAVTAHDNLIKPNISAEIDRLFADIHMNRNEVLARLAGHAKGSLEYFIDGNEIDLTTDDAKEHFYLLKKAKTKTRKFRNDDGELVTETDIEIELHDPQAALVHIGRHLKLFTDKLEVDDTGLTDEQRADRIARILETARTRRAGQLDTQRGPTD